jgi:hypothetical protein
MPRPLYPRRKNLCYSLDKRLGGPKKRVWTTFRRENSLPYRHSNSDLSLFQRVASRYDGCAIPAPSGFQLKFSTHFSSVSYVHLILLVFVFIIIHCLLKNISYKVSLCTVCPVLLRILVSFKYLPQCPLLIIQNQPSTQQFFINISG